MELTIEVSDSISMIDSLRSEDSGLLDYLRRWLNDKT